MNKPKVQNQSTKQDPTLEALPLACADDLAAVEFMENQRWGDAPCCPRCASVGVVKLLSGGVRKAPYRWFCNDCKKAGYNALYTVRTDTVFEDSKAPLRHWCYAFWRASTSKKGVSALELHRHTGLSYKTCLFMLARIRYAMSDSAPAILGPGGGDVEVDETYVGGKPRHIGQGKRGRGTKKACVLAAVERGGAVKTKPIASVSGHNLKQFIRDNVDQSARILTDQNNSYRGIGKEFARGHKTVNHGIKQYVRRGTDIHSNTIEGFFSLVKRGINGIYHSVSKEHLHRYMSEFEFRYNHRELSDGPRTVKAIQGAQGKRLTYRQSVA